MSEKTIEEQYEEIEAGEKLIAEILGPSGLLWITQFRRVGDLKEWSRNPRQISDEQAKQLAKSLIKFGYVDPVVINTDNQIIGGHMRLRVLKQLKYITEDSMILVMVPSRELNPEEFEELAIRLNKNTGAWDFDALATNFDTNKLREYGFNTMDFSAPAIKDMKATNLKPAGVKVCPICGTVIP